MAVYAPEVSHERRPSEIFGTYSGWRPESAVRRLGDQALFTKDLRIHRDTLLRVPRGQRDVSRADELSLFWDTCRAVWTSAQSVAGVVDLVEVDQLLAAELWAAAQLAADLRALLDQR
ncbi:hypothetical protein [Kitasatospora sp. NPDC127060]|uniref:hypothetical protein n=1 Tax=Kitasatospora sp. NPDC127060 TaxID=3347121 RepID=UPI00364EB917